MKYDGSTLNDWLILSKNLRKIDTFLAFFSVWKYSQHKQQFEETPQISQEVCLADKLLQTRRTIKTMFIHHHLQVSYCGSVSFLSLAFFVSPHISKTIWLNIYGFINYVYHRDNMSMQTYDSSGNQPSDRPVEGSFLLRCLVFFMSSKLRRHN